MSLGLFLLQTQLSPEQQQQIQHIAMGLMTLIPIMIVVGLAVMIVPFWFICKKAGFSPWLSLLHIVPMGGLVLYYVLAFSDWKVTPVSQAAWLPSAPIPPQPPFPPRA